MPEDASRGKWGISLGASLCAPVPLFDEPSNKDSVHHVCAQGTSAAVWSKRSRMSDSFGNPIGISAPALDGLKLADKGVGKLSTLGLKGFGELPVG
jgi:hypothetical protein